MKNGIDETKYSQEAYERLKKLEQYSTLRAQKCNPAIIFKILEISRSSYYRWKFSYAKYGLIGLENESREPHKKRTANAEIKKLVLQWRNKYPLWGKYKIATIIRRENKIPVSVSKVGRIISNAIAQNIIKPACFFYGRLRSRRARDFNKHAQKWQYGQKAQKVGELVQIDHMTISHNGESAKHFKAICPITRITAEQAYTSASSNIAAQFLSYVQQELPFPLISIQVDGGSEFMGKFEEACRQQNIPLFVLPPRSPKYNGAVERGNSTDRYEFYRFYDGSLTLDVLRPALKRFVHTYNTFRPHQALQYLTPQQYYSQLRVL
jgi:putative transposase